QGRVEGAGGSIPHFRVTATGSPHAAVLWESVSRRCKLPAANEFSPALAEPAGSASGKRTMISAQSEFVASTALLICTTGAQAVLVISTDVSNSGASFFRLNLRTGHQPK